MKTLVKTLSLFLIIISTQGRIYAHPGNTASDGCHYCRTNCAKWGEVEGARHCHGGSSAPTTTYTQPSCPANASYSSLEKSCICNVGYALSIDKVYCVKIPANAHSVDSNTDVWECDYGYEEINNSCVVIKIEDSKPNPPTTAQNDTTTSNTTSTYNYSDTAPADEEISDSEALLGLLVLGGVYAGKKYLDKRKASQTPK